MQNNRFSDALIQQVIDVLNDDGLDVDARAEAVLKISCAEQLEGLGILASGIAHDFNNLLTAIMGNAELLRADLDPDDPAAHTLGTIVTASRRASELAEQLLVFTGPPHFALGRLDCVGVLRSLKQVDADGVTFDVSVPEHLPAVNGSAEELTSILDGIVGATTDALRNGGGAVHVSAGTAQYDRAQLDRMFLGQALSPGDYAFIEIAADAEIGSDAFDPYFTRTFFGDRVLLSKVFAVMKGHKGAIDIAREAGSRARLRLLMPALRDAST